ncbi:hypothetical protein [Clostridium sp.]|uniref:hypothetical protein n=1 Tax=Clostridium sp. TaxID=1506 RepID=UPI003F33E9CA
MKRIIGFILTGIMCVTITSCTSNQNNTSMNANNNSVSGVVEFSISDGYDMWEIGVATNNLFDGGGTRSENDEYVLYTYADKMISTKIDDRKEVIRYISTKNTNDYTGRGISVGNSLEELLDAYGDELTLEPEWTNYHLASDKYDEVYKYANNDESTQIIFSLKEDTIIMIQIATNQKQNNISLEL